MVDRNITPRAARAARRNQIRALAEMRNFRVRVFVSRLSTAAVLIQRHILQSFNPTVFTLFNAIQRAIRLQPDFQNITIFYEQQGGIVNPVTLLPQFLEDFDVFRERVEQIASPIRGIGSDGFIVGQGEPVFELDTRLFDVRSLRARLLGADVPFPGGPRGGVWEHPKNLGGVWKSSLMEWKYPDAKHTDTVALDGFCVRLLADRIFEYNVQWQSLDAVSRNDWDVFRRHVAHAGKIIKKVDPTYVMVNYQMAFDFLSKIVWSIHRNEIDVLNMSRVIVFPQGNYNGKWKVAVPLELFDHSGRVPYAPNVLPVLFQRNHVDAPILDDNRCLTMHPDMFWVVGCGRNIYIAKARVRTNAVNFTPSPWTPVEDVRISNLGTNWIIGDSSEYMSCKSLLNAQCGLKKHAYVSFDIETAPKDKLHGGDGSFACISCSASWIEHDDLEASDEEFLERVNTLMENNTLDWVGDDCIQGFLTWINGFSDGYDKVTVVTFNGARFDHQLLLAEVLKHHGFQKRNGLGDKYQPKSLHKTRGKFVNFNWLNISLFDLALHIASSLQKAGKSFGVPSRWRKIEGGPEHSEIQDIFARLGHDMWITARGVEYQKLCDYRRYGKNDATCTIILYRQFVHAYRKMDLYNLENTIGAQAYQAFKETLPSVREEIREDLERTHTKEELRELNILGMLPRLTPEEDDMERSNVVAGAVKLPNGPVSLRGKVIESLDVTSQYPTSMIKDADGWFGAGLRDLVERPTLEQCKLNTHVGKFLIDVCQWPVWQRTGHVLFPYKQMGIKKTALNEERPMVLKNHWNPDRNNFDRDHELTPKEEDWVTSAKLTGVLVGNLELRTMIEEGCTVTVHECLIHRNRIAGSVLFAVMEKWEKTKAFEDSRKGTSQYNGALREVAKLLLNSLSGKLMQGWYTETIEIVADKELVKKFDQYSLKRQVPALRNYVESVWFVEVAKRIEDVQEKQYPVEWGKKVYEVSRMRMFNTIYKAAGRAVLYSDTDCAKGETNAFAPARQLLGMTYLPVHPQVLERFPAYGTMPLLPEHGKMFGIFEDEHKDMIKDRPELCIGGIIGKKCFGYSDGTTIKMSCKGMRGDAVWHEDQGMLRQLAEDIRTTKKERNKVEAYIRDHMSDDFVVLGEIDIWEARSDALLHQEVEHEKTLLRLVAEADPDDGVRRMKAVRLFQDIAERVVNEAYAIVFWMDRTTPTATAGMTMIDVAEHFTDIGKIVPRYGIKKVSRQNASLGAEWVDGHYD